MVCERNMGDNGMSVVKHRVTTNWGEMDGQVRRWSG